MTHGERAKGPNTMIKAIDAGAIPTQVDARTMAFDTKTKKIFLPTAEYLVTPATGPAKRPTRTVKPGTFGVLVVSK